MTESRTIASRDVQSADLTVPLAAVGAWGFGAELIGEKEIWTVDHADSLLAGWGSSADKTSSETIQLTALFGNDKGWSYVIRPGAEFSRSSHVALRDSEVFSCALGGFYTTVQKVQLGLGISWMQHMNARSKVIPFPIINWKLSDQWQLTSLTGDNGTLAYRINESFSVLGELQFHSRDRRLSAGSSPAAVLRTEEYPILLGLEWRAGRHLTLLLRCGKAAAQSLEFLGSSGESVLKSEVHTPAVLEIEADVRF